MHYEESIITSDVSKLENLRSFFINYQIFIIHLCLAKVLLLFLKLKRYLVPEHYYELSRDVIWYVVSEN
jgi:hypothetical protein